MVGEFVVERVQPMQTAAGGMEEWGIKGKSGFLATYKEGYSGLLANSRFGRRPVSGTRHSIYTIAVKNRSKSTLEIVCFRASYDSVAEFRFSIVSYSYANLRHGDTRNVGVIGIVVFAQKGIDPWIWMPEESSPPSRSPERQSRFIESKSPKIGAKSQIMKI